MTSAQRRYFVSAFSCLLFGLSLGLTGCTLQNTASVTPENVAGTSIAGVVHGGAQAITGARVYLLAVNPTGYGGPGIAPGSNNASISLLNVTSTRNAADAIGSYVLTNNTNGWFNVAGDYSCSSGYAQSTGTPVTLSGSEQVYLYVLGGNTGAGINANSGLLVALGPCNNPTTQVTVNEVTTIATAYAFAGFASDATHVGSSGSALALTNLNIAFNNVANLATTSNGAATGSTSTMTTPAAQLYLLADILAACVDEVPTGCATLFQYAQSAGASGTAPADTATAAINLAHNPWPTQAGVDALYNVVQGNGGPYADALSYEPNDFTLVLGFTGGGLSNPSGIAIDAEGNVWLGDYTGIQDGLTEFSSNGTPLSPANGFNGGGLTDHSGPYGIAIDTLGNVWVTEQLTNSLSSFTSNGQPRSPSGGYTGGGLGDPQAIAIDGTNHIWVLSPGSIDVGGSVSEFSDSGSSILAAPYSSGAPNAPYGNAQAIALDKQGRIWLANYGDSLTEYAPSGLPLSPTSTGFIGGGLNIPVAIAVDASENIWVANDNNGSVSEFSNSGTPISPASGDSTGFSDSQPDSIAIDGAGSIWVANGDGAGISEFSNSGATISPATSYITGYVNNGGNLLIPLDIAVDGAGNVWVAGADNSGSVLSEFIGAATPVVTPLAGNFVAPYTHPASLP